MHERMKNEPHQQEPQYQNTLSTPLVSTTRDLELARVTRPYLPHTTNQAQYTSSHELDISRFGLNQYTFEQDAQPLDIHLSVIKMLAIWCF
jgi:hypothetical protein